MYAEHGKHPREALFYAVIMLSYRDTLLDLNCLNTAGIGILIRGVARIFQGGHPVSKWGYRIYSNKRRAAFRGAYFIFRVTSAALIRGRRLFKNCTWQIYFFYIFIQRYTFCLLIFLWTDTKLIVNLELREKFTRWKQRESFMNESEIISGESELLCCCGTIYNVQSILMSLSPHRGPGVALIRVNTVCTKLSCRFQHLF